MPCRRFLHSTSTSSSSKLQFPVIWLLVLVMAHSGLCYQQPAEQWSEALPVGNGSLGAMVYGRVATELVQLNEDSVWFGNGAQRRMAHDAYSKLSDLRRLIREHRHPEAERLVENNFFSRPSAMRHYEPLATLKLCFTLDDVPYSNYKRSLCLEDGVSRVEYDTGDIHWKREVFSSYPDNAIVMRIVANEQFSFMIKLSRLSENEWDTNEFFDDLRIRDSEVAIGFGTVNTSGLQSRCTARVVCTNGSVQRMGNGLSVTTDDAILIIEARTNFRSNGPVLKIPSFDSALAQRTWYDGLLSRHVHDYHSLFDSAQLRLHSNDVSSDNIHWTDELLSSPPGGRLFQTYHNFGRYLLISCSRTYKLAPTLSLPANLQGIWNPSFSPAWGSKFTININLQMNYWPCHAWNLSTLSDPLFFLLERMSKRGRKTAQEMYGVNRAGSWCAHHNTDLWADCDPADEWMPSTLWPLGGAWLSLHIYERYQYQGPNDQLDGESFLSRMFPVLQGSAAFVLGLLVEDADHRYLIPSPSLSPENTYAFLDSSQQLVKGVMCEGSTMDVAIVRLVFEHYRESVIQMRSFFPAAMSLLDDELLNDVQEAHERLPPLVIGTDGRLLEWQRAYQEPEPGHRHFSHLFALYPGTSITPNSTPELAEACREVLKVRLANGGAHTGWSRVWLICLYARLHDAEECLKHLELLLQNSTQPNLFDSHPPMQIDGNFGGCAGILEMLIQSHEVETTSQPQQPVRTIRLLPACPARWLAEAGELRDIQARGGFLLSFRWERSRLQDEIMVTSQGRESGRVHLPDGRCVDLPPEKATWRICLGASSQDALQNTRVDG